MIRLNAFFETKEGVTAQQVTDATADLISKSQQEEGCRSYDLFQSTTRPSVYVFCETWANQEALDRHAASAHFTAALPRIEALAKEALYIDKFEK